MKNVLISTGGTGGHVIPALNIHDHLKNNFKTFLVSDIRGSKYIDKNTYKADIINIPRLGKNFIYWPKRVINIIFSFIKSFIYLKKNNIDILISTGGYMSTPLCFASIILKKKLYLFEPNSLLGSSNKFFLKYSNKIICYQNILLNFPNKYNNKIVNINPILKKNFYNLRKFLNSDFKDKLKILVIGGSQGANFFDKTIFRALKNMHKKVKIEVCQQISDKKNESFIKSEYEKNNIESTLFLYNEKIFETINNYNLAIVRCGASTMAELTFLNLPFIGIPFPFAKDDHQYINAQYYEKKNCCWILKQDNNTADKLVILLNNILQNRDTIYEKKHNMAKISSQNNWRDVNKTLVNLLNEN